MENSTSVAREHPLVVDLDGTLSKVDTLHESLLLLLVQHPLAVLGVARTLLSKGKGAFKSQVASLVVPDTTHLPLRQEVVDLLQSEKALGRRIVLATGAHTLIAQGISNRLGCFDEVLATSDQGANFIGAVKRDKLLERFGSEGFDYIGDSRSDLPVWAASRKALFAGSVKKWKRLSAASSVELERISPALSNARPAWKILRPHQWVKNILVFLPLLASHKWQNGHLVTEAMLAFVAFCCAASTVYVVNDLLDRQSDRKNPSKARRPIASGTLTIPAAVALSLALLGITTALCTQLPLPAAIGIATYLIANAGYSLHFKRKLLVDVFLLASMYVWRIEVGGLATGIQLTSWLTGFSIFLFLSLAFAKRYAEVIRLGARSEQKAGGRAWRIDDALPLAASGIGTGVGGAIVLALYVTSDSFAQLYRKPELVLFLAPLFLYWITRIWIQACRQELDEDPVLFASKDPISYLVAAIAAVILVAAMI